MTTFFFVKFVTTFPIFPGAETAALPDPAIL